MKLLFIGDVNARPGRQILKDFLQPLKEEYSIDLVVANVENAAHGIGISPKLADEILELGVDVMTGGNHLYNVKEIVEYLPAQPRLLRAANFPSSAPGFAHFVGESDGVPYFVATLSGRTFMKPLDCPFQAFDSLVKYDASGIPIRIIDFHAEATSEKVAFGLYADGRASAVIGTHTHVQTADERILPGGAAYITDVGMTGPHNGVIGVQADAVIQRFITGMPTRFEPADGDVMLHAVVIDIDEASGRARSIERIQRRNE